MIDATFVEATKQRNTREENVLIKEGAIPIEWGKDENKHKLAQKDTEARWTKKNNETHYGFKNHINADQTHKLIQAYTVTDAAVHDSQAIDGLLDKEADANGDKRAVYADSAYRSAEREAKLAQQNITSQICEKGRLGRPLSEEQKSDNLEKFKVRSRVEHVFGAQAQMGGHWVRAIGLLRAKIKIGMMNLVYNMMRLVQLTRRDGKVASAIA
jgi:IS5 family transposase